MSLSGSIFIYNLPTTAEFLDDGFIPITNSEITRKIGGSDLREYIDKTVSIPNTTTLNNDDFIKVDSVSIGTRKAIVRNSIFYSVPSGNLASNNQLVKGDDIRLTNQRPPSPHVHVVSDIVDFNPSNYVLTASVGLPNGVAPIGPDGKVPSIFINTGSGVSSADLITSVPSNLVTQTNVQGAINQLSDASFIRINSASANVIGTQTVQGALNQKLSLSGGTLTGPLFAISNGFRVGTSDLVVSSNNVGIGTIPTSRLDVNGQSRFRDIINIRNGGFGSQITLSDENGQTKRFGIWRDPIDELVIGPQNTSGAGTRSLSIRRNSDVSIDSKLVIPTNRSIQFGENEENSDPVAIARVNVGTNRTELRIMIGDETVSDPAFMDRVVIGTGLDVVNNFTPRFSINSDGTTSGISNIYPYIHAIQLDSFVCDDYLNFSSETTSAWYYYVNRIRFANNTATYRRAVVGYGNSLFRVLPNSIESESTQYLIDPFPKLIQMTTNNDHGGPNRLQMNQPMRVEVALSRDRYIVLTFNGNDANWQFGVTTWFSATRIAIGHYNIMGTDQKMNFPTFFNASTVSSITSTPSLNPNIPPSFI